MQAVNSPTHASAVLVLSSPAAGRACRTPLVPPRVGHSGWRARPPILCNFERFPGERCPCWGVAATCVVPWRVPADQDGRVKHGQLRCHRDASRTSVALWPQGLQQWPGSLKPPALLSSHSLPSLPPGSKLFHKLNPVSWAEKEEEGPMEHRQGRGFNRLGRDRG